MIEGKRGRSGGLRLARPAAEISIGEVVRQTEENFALVECFAPGEEACKISSACRFAWMLHEALTAFLQVLGRYSLADILSVRQTLLERLGLDEAHRAQ